MNTTAKNSTNPSTKLFVIACIATILLGVILHFAYDFLSKSFIIGLFTPVNESIWEHLKLVLIPLTSFAIVYTLIYRKKEDIKYNFWYYLTKSIILGMTIIVIVHYGYKFIFKDVPGFINILIYIIAMIIAFYKIYMNMLSQSKNIDKSIVNRNRIGIITLIFLYMLFIVFTIYPPQLELFRDPINNTFGIFLL